MLKNYFKIAFRNIGRHKGYTFLNVAGLAIGMAACLLIAFFVRNERSYDTYHQAADQLYRVAIDIKVNAGNRVFAQTSAPLAAALEKDFPQIEKAVRLRKQGNQLIAYSPEKSFYENNFYLSDPAIFELFTIPLIKGNPQTALNRPGTLVITEAVAKKYFGNAEPMGKILKINKKPFEVTGVMQNLPYNSHLKFDLITSLATWESEAWFEDTARNWHSTMFYTYIKVKENVNVPAFEKQVKSAADKYVSAELKEWGVAYHFFLQPVKSIHLHSQLRDEAEVPGNATNVYILMVVAVLIIVIASLNYINLTTAQSANRAKEVGVRKVIGATKMPLVIQFMCESLLLTFMALGLALAIVFFTRPLFETLTGQTYNFGLIFTPQFVLILTGLTVVLGVLAAIYPALLLSSFRPVAVLKGSLSLGTSGAGMRKVLVVCQFAISLMLLVGTIMVYRQLNFMKNQNLGFNKEQMLVLPVRGNTSIADRYEQIKNEFQNHPAILSAAASANVPGEGVENYSISLIGETDDKTQSINYLFTDFDFLKTYGIGMVAGRAFDKAIKTDAETAFLINEKGLKAFGWATPEEAIGKKLDTGFGRQGEIIGVYKDFHYRSLQAPIEPLVMAVSPSAFKAISLRLRTENLPATMAFVQQKWQELFPQNPYEYAFLDEAFNKQYQADEKIGRTFLVFTGIAIFIACLGLFGLATFVAQQRTKEIGVRKVLGASVTNIVTLVSKDFVKLVVIAFVIATPLSYALVSKWLENFASRISIGWTTFALAGLALLAIALLTVSYQSIKAALANPVKSLRNE